MTVLDPAGQGISSVQSAKQGVLEVRRLRVTFFNWHIGSQSESEEYLEVLRAAFDSVIMSLCL